MHLRTATCSCNTMLAPTQRNLTRHLRGLCLRGATTQHRHRSSAAAYGNRALLNDTEFSRNSQVLKALSIGTILMRGLTFVSGHFSFISWKMLNPEVFIQLWYFAAIKRNIIQLHKPWVIILHSAHVKAVSNSAGNVNGVPAMWLFWQFRFAHLFLPNGRLMALCPI